jgi:hypothetical protein
VGYEGIEGREWKGKTRGKGRKERERGRIVIVTAGKCP